jgi:hypothetical protein
LPDAVKVPASNSVMMETMTAGAVIRQCRANKDMAGQYEWAFVGLDAGLRNRAGKVVGRYYGPPATWESVDGSNVTGTQVAVVPTDTGNISFQLVKANPAMGMGAIQGVRYIQHVKTGGGCSTAIRLHCRHVEPKAEPDLHRRLHLLASDANLTVIY